jgi:hypothetical protein
MSDEHEQHHGEHHNDPTFYRSPRDAAAAPAEKLAYVATFARPADKPDAIAVVDVGPDSAAYSSVYGHRLRFWDMKTRKNIQTVDLGDQHQMALELRPAHDVRRVGRPVLPGRRRRLDGQAGRHR